MPLTVPPAVNYQSPLNAAPSRVLSPPKEGNKLVSVEIDWSTMGGANNCVEINMQNNATLEFSQIVALKIDNSLCGATVRFVFPDTMETLTIPSYTPDAIVPIFSNSKQFFVLADGAIPDDVTRFQILNFLPPPVVVPVSTEQQTALIAGISAGAAATVQIIAADINGTMEAAQIQFGVASAVADSNVVITLKDGNGKFLAQGVAFVKTGDSATATIVSLQSIAVRFEGGVEAEISGLLVNSGQFNVCAYYRLP